MEAVEAVFEAAPLLRSFFGTSITGCFVAAQVKAVADIAITPTKRGFIVAVFEVFQDKYAVFTTVRIGQVGIVAGTFAVQARRFGMAAFVVGPYTAVKQRGEVVVQFDTVLEGTAVEAVNLGRAQEFGIRRIGV